MSADLPPAVSPADVPGESVFVETNGVRLHTVQAGPDDGPLVVLLHGFPEFWYGWHEAIGPLANAGYRVVVPDQRGYNRSEKPDSVSAYHVRELAADVVGLLDAIDHEQAHITGHDWGAMVAWWTALHYADRVTSLCAVNTPHPSVLRETLRRSWSQRLRMWYTVAFQVPKLPEHVSWFGNWWLPVRMMRQSSRPGTFTDTDFEYYRAAWSQPGAFEAMLHWYRAAARARPRPVRERVTLPTLVAWGTRDQFLRTSMARESVARCDDGRLALFHDATHWIQHEEPVALIGRIQSFLDGQ